MVVIAGNRRRPIGPSRPGEARSLTTRSTTQPSAEIPTSSMDRTIPTMDPFQQSVGPYKIGKTIGKGQFGKVKLAVHQETGEKVALKIIAKGKLETSTLKMVKREVMIMKLLNHQNIVRLYEVLENEEYLILVMEYASGGEVIDFIIAHSRLKEPVARQFFRQIIAAIDYCHSLHVIHRDLKPENLLLDHQFHIKIIDFGLSNRFKEGALLKTFCGSPTYTAPELILQQPYQGPAIDIWSLGVVLFVLVCGYLPFDGASFQELFQKITAGTYQIPDFVSQGCSSLIQRMLVTDPTKRATMDEVREHPWILHRGQPVPKAIPPNCVSRVASEKDLDMEIIQEISTTFGMPEAEIKQSVLGGTYDDASSTYFLLASHKESAKTRRSSSSTSPRHRPDHRIERETSRRTSRGSASRGSTSRGSSSRDSASPTGSHSPRTEQKKEPTSSTHLASSNTRAPPFKDGKFKAPSHRRSRTEGESVSVQKSKITIGSETPVISIESPKKRTGSILDSSLAVAERSTAHGKKREEISPLATTDPVKIPKKESPRQISSDGTQKRSGTEEIIIPFEISPPKQQQKSPHKNSPKEYEMKNLARSWRLTFGSLQDNTLGKVGIESDDSTDFESDPKPREVRIPVHHRTITTESPDCILARIKSCLVENGFISQWSAHYCLVCQKNNLVFELEICSLPNLDIHGIKFSRISGDIWLYKKICKKLLKKIKATSEKDTVLVQEKV